jgi:hypothetical protein
MFTIVNLDINYARSKIENIENQKLYKNMPGENMRNERRFYIVRVSLQ